MTLKNNLKKVLETLSEEKLASILDGQETSEEKYQELEQSITNLAKTIRDLDERITSLATTHEELLYLLDQSPEQPQEDINHQPAVSLSENKYGLN